MIKRTLKEDCRWMWSIGTKVKSTQTMKKIIKTSLIKGIDKYIKKFKRPPVVAYVSQKMLEVALLETLPIPTKYKVKTKIDNDLPMGHVTFSHVKPPRTRRKK